MFEMKIDPSTDLHIFVCCMCSNLWSLMLLGTGYIPNRASDNICWSAQNHYFFSLLHCVHNVVRAKNPWPMCGANILLGEFTLL